MGSVPLSQHFEAAHAEAPQEPPSSGDFHAAFLIPDGSGKMGFILGDVTGHGPEAAEHADRLKAAIRGGLEEGLTPGETLGFVNAAAEADPEFDRFATVVAGTIEPETGEIHYASGGHEPALVTSPASSEATPDILEELSTTGPPLGVLSGDQVHYRTQQTTLPEGGTLLVYSDGVTEARRGRAFLGIDRFRSWLRRFLPLSPLRLVRKLLGKVRAFSGGSKIRDDVAILAVKRHTSSDSSDS